MILLNILLHSYTKDKVNITGDKKTIDCPQYLRVNSIVKVVMVIKIKLFTQIKVYVRQALEDAKI